MTSAFLQGFVRAPFEGMSSSPLRLKHRPHRKVQLGFFSALGGLNFSKLPAAERRLEAPR